MKTPWREKQDMLGEINVSAAYILHRFYKFAEGDVPGEDIGERKKREIVADLDRLRELCLDVSASIECEIDRLS